ncbi:centromere protein M isoform X1 [Sorex araneus]|uniref:centromere protein M isoform X1 n=1 Tax=Sorex araneus TaxID=42254 RepID=UPI002433B6FA|nr:centromere protein M isoform X1 [Sorex araneus]
MDGGRAHAQRRETDPIHQPVLAGQPWDIGSPVPSCLEERVRSIWRVGAPYNPCTPSAGHWPLPYVRCPLGWAHVVFIPAIFCPFSHLANSLPLPSNVSRPRIDLIVFLINLHNKFSLHSVEGSLQHVDATFFLGKVLFLVTGASREDRCSTHRSTVEKLARTYRSPLLFCEVETEPLRGALALRLLRLLLICAGHVPGVSALDLLALLRRPESPALDEL